MSYCLRYIFAGMAVILGLASARSTYENHHEQVYHPRKVGTCVLIGRNCTLAESVAANMVVLASCQHIL